ncbi:AMP-binding protein [Actinoplanes sp. NEAU-A12]|uniref:AMP-binding protein n=1 Tax=Actinoplanes sandaracinus TaxID=3045177 RepID=A0ABT6WI14_9ACTN|nr:MbtH family NRPS accessory protein [Actinoplanes sandaracinus]MDI6099377.1 AMP-binding protein [Actinoplanes sandaracinus]
MRAVKSAYFRIVVNEIGDRGVWPVGQMPPAGWRATPFAGTVEACADQVAELGARQQPGDGPAPVSRATDETLVRALRAVARRQPDAPALRLGTRSLTYRQLWDAVDSPAGDRAGPVGDLLTALVDGAAQPVPELLVMSGDLPVRWRHRTLLRLAGECGLPRLGPGSRLLQSSPAGHPLFPVEVLRALLTGAELVLAPAGVPCDAQALTVLAGGPGLTRFAAGPDVLLGCPETTMLCAVTVPGTASCAPLPGGHLYVFDERFRPAEAGELYVGGEPIAAGYLDRPDLTLSRFLPDPLSSRHGRLMFRTGLRVRRLPAGRIEMAA